MSNSSDGSVGFPRPKHTSAFCAKQYAQSDLVTITRRNDTEYSSGHTFMRRLFSPYPQPSSLLFFCVLSSLPVVVGHADLVHLHIGGSGNSLLMVVAGSSSPKRSHSMVSSVDGWSAFDDGLSVVPVGRSKGNGGCRSGGMYRHVLLSSEE